MSGVVVNVIILTVRSVVQARAPVTETDTSHLLKLEKLRLTASPSRVGTGQSKNKH